MAPAADPLDRWKNRRKMAWYSMIAGLAYPLLVLGSKSTELGEIAIPFYSFVTMVVVAYIGARVVDDNNMKGEKGVKDVP